MPARPYRERPPVEPEPETTRLGSLRSVHAPPPLHRALLGPILIAGLIVAVGAAFGEPLSILIAIAAVTLAALAWAPLRVRGWSVALHAQGLVVVRPGTRRALAFEDVNEVWFETEWLHSQAGAYLRALHLIDYDGEAHRVPMAVGDGGILANSVLHACSGPLLLEARRALAEGETLTFGKIQLDRAGITVSGARMAWSEIRRVAVSHARVHLYRRLPILAWRTVRLDRIANPVVFVGLVARCVPETRVEDQLIAPLAAEVKRSGRSGRSSAARALWQMLFGGIVSIAGLLFTWTTCSVDGRPHVVTFVLIFFGAYHFVQGLAALRSGRRR